MCSQSWDRGVSFVVQTFGTKPRLWLHNLDGSPYCYSWQSSHRDGGQLHVERWHLGLHETGVQPLLLVEKGWGPRLRFRQQHVLFLDIMAGKEDHKRENVE